MCWDLGFRVFGICMEELWIVMGERWFDYEWEIRGGMEGVSVGGDLSVGLRDGRVFWRGLEYECGKIVGRGIEVDDRM